MWDYRVWWALFVFFLVFCVLALQRGYRRWWKLRQVMAGMTGSAGEAQARWVRREGWRLASMATALGAMLALVFVALLGGPPGLILSLRMLAVAGVVGVVILSLRR